VKDAAFRSNALRCSGDRAGAEQAAPGEKLIGRKLIQHPVIARRSFDFAQDMLLPKQSPTVPKTEIASLRSARNDSKKLCFRSSAK